MVEVSLEAKRKAMLRAAAGMLYNMADSPEVYGGGGWRQVMETATQWARDEWMEYLEDDDGGS